MERDLLVMPAVTTDEAGGSPLDRVGVDFYEARPIALDDGRVLLNTPGGFLLAVDRTGGGPCPCTTSARRSSPWSSHRETRSLLVGCEDHSAYLLTL